MCLSQYRPGLVIATTACWDTLTHGVECVPVLVSSRDGHSYYGVLGYSDTLGGVCTCPSIWHSEEWAGCPSIISCMSQ